MEPDTIQDEVFGEMGYDPPLEEWYASVDLPSGQRLDVTVWWREKKDGPFAPVLELAREAFVRFREQEPEHRMALAAAMLERWRSSALVQKRLPDVTAFARKLTVKQLSIATDGSASAQYDDPTDLFGDHSIMVDLAADGSFIGFSLQG